MKRMVLVVVAILAVLLAVPRAQVRAEVALRAAMEQETVKGDLKGAIESYQKIVDGYPKDRAARAQAMIRMAGCYQKLGDAQAKTIYERVIRDFADQTEAVTAAKSGLSRSSAAPRPETFTVRHLGEGEPWSAVSRDGRYVTSTDWKTGDLTILDVNSGETRRLTNFGKPNADYAQEVVFSPSGKQVAYAWLRTVGNTNIWNENGSRFDLRLVGTADSSGTAPRILVDRSDIAWIAPYDWSGDGQWLTVALTLRDRTTQVGLVSVENGSLRVLKTLRDWRGVGKVLLSPDGRYIAFDAPASAEETLRHDIFVVAVDGSSDTAPVVHASHDLVVGWTDEGLVFASDRGGSFGIYAIAVSNGRALGSPRLLRGGLGPLTPMGLTASGSFYYTLSTGGVSDIHLTTVDFAKGELTSAPAALPDFMGDNVSPAWSRDGKYLAYVRRSNGGGEVLTVRSMETNKILREIQPTIQAIGASLSWAPDGRSLFTLGSDAKGRRGLFRIEISTGAMTSIALNAVTPAWSADGKKLLYALRDGQESVVVEYDPGSGEGRELMRSSAPISSARMSFDARQLFYRRAGAQPADPAVFVHRDLSSGVEKILASGRLGNVNLSPDGKWIVTVTDGAAGKTRELFVVSTDGGPRRTLLQIDGPTQLNFVAWAPDSSAVLARQRFVPPDQSSHPSRIELWWVPLAGVTPRKLHDYATTGDSGTALSLNADGRLAFSVAPENKRKLEIWAMDRLFDRPAVKK